MKTMAAAVVLLFCFSFIITGCRPEDDIEIFQSNPLIEAIEIGARTTTGQVNGTAKAVWSLSEGKVVCTDEAAEYQMTLSKDNKLPTDTLLTVKLPDKSQYFRLDITGVMRILEKGKCIDRDPSDDRVHLWIEGYFEGSNYKFNALNCSSSSISSTTEIYFSSEYVVKGEAECVFTDQMKYTFQFADLKLK